MEEASRIVLNGFTVPTDTKIFRYPDRYMDKRGVVMWDKVKELLDGFSQVKKAISDVG
jgi:DNA polymerase I